MQIEQCSVLHESADAVHAVDRHTKTDLFEELTSRGVSTALSSQRASPRELPHPGEVLRRPPSRQQHLPGRVHDAHRCHDMEAPHRPSRRSSPERHACRDAVLIRDVPDLRAAHASIVAQPVPRACP